MLENRVSGNPQIDLADIDLTRPIPADETERQYYFMAKAVNYVRELGDKLGRKPTCCVTTFGCPTV